ncbi:Crp/Fnr family transcriptional regulator [Ideonella sp. A 288]|uniref:Crp/Fnr family transcriptional regulator n=1 Tax=Ideonella sp. A 288 TaxID=1962181 RepID=UPI001303CE98|nr:cyclic nucleotide-binding domain-containing protein [Ideonella sp. A 288]
MTTIGYAFGFIGAGLMVASYMMKSMMPLRVVALAANVFLVAYAMMGGSWPTMVLYAVMIPINVKKVREIRKLVKAIESAKADTPVAEWLLPHMHRREAKAGQPLWNKGDVATEMIYVQAGTLRLVERDERIGAGALVGEIGLFAPDNRRTMSIVCDTDCTLYSLSAEGMAALYYQNPKLGYHVMRLVVERLMRDAEQARVAAAAALAPPEPQSGAVA